jgi:hypothetical protein
VDAGEITEAAALERIQDVQRRVVEITALLEKSGRTDPKKPLMKRYEKITAEPLDPTSDAQAIEVRGDLTRAMGELDALLDAEFRVPNSTPESESVPSGLPG